MDSEVRSRRQSKRVAHAQSRAVHGKKGKAKRKSAALAIDFGKLQMRSLKRYRDHYKLPVDTQLSKFELIQAVRKHFVRSQRLHHAEVWSMFLFAIQEDKQRELRSDFD